MSISPQLPNEPTLTSPSWGPPGNGRPPSGSVEGPPPPEGVLERLLRVIRTRKWTILQSIVVVTLVVGVLTLRQSNVYTASAALLFSDQDPSLVGDTTAVVDPTRVAATNEQLIKLPVIADRTAKRIGGGLTGAQVLSDVSVDSSGDSNLVPIHASAPAPRLAARIANTYAREYIAFRRTTDRARVADAIKLVQQSLAALPPDQRAGPEGTRLSSRLRQLQLSQSLQTGNASLVQTASPPSGRSSPNVKRNLALGLLLGAVLGFGLAFLRERLDRTIKDVDQVERLFPIPLLGRIPRSSRLRNRLTGRRPAPEGGDAEAFRTLRANLRYLNYGGALRSLLIASPMPGDGKSTIARSLALTMAAMGDRVVLVDADLRKNRSPDAPRGGLSSVLAGGSLDDALVSIPVEAEGALPEELVVLPAGPTPPNPSQLLETERMQDVLAELQERFDLVLVDSPALSVVSDGLALVPAVSGVIVVVGLDHTERDAASAVWEQLHIAGAVPLGVVVNFSVGERNAYGYYLN